MPNALSQPIELGSKHLTFGLYFSLIKMDNETGPNRRVNSRRFMYRRSRPYLRANRGRFHSEPIERQVINNQRIYGKYVCGNCNRVWTSRYAIAGQSRNCNNCSNPVIPEIYVPARRANDVRMFGSFKCLRCNRYWKSAYTWQGYSQLCKNCGTRVYSYDRTALLHGISTGERRPHERSLCERCIELGRDCSGS